MTSWGQLGSSSGWVRASYAERRQRLPPDSCSRRSAMVLWKNHPPGDQTKYPKRATKVHIGWFCRVGAWQHWRGLKGGGTVDDEAGPPEYSQRGGGRLRAARKQKQPPLQA